MFEYIADIHSETAVLGRNTGSKGNPLVHDTYRNFFAN